MPRTDRHKPHLVPYLNSAAPIGYAYPPLRVAHLIVQQNQTKNYVKLDFSKKTRHKRSEKHDLESAKYISSF